MNADIASLSFRPAQADYSLALDRVIFISSNPNQLHIYDPMAHTDQVVALPDVPLNFSLSPSGLHAAVALTNSVSYVDLRNASVVKTYLNIAILTTEYNTTGQVVCGASYIYVLPSYVGTPMSIEIATGQVTNSPWFAYGSGGTLNAATNEIYITENGSFPNSLHTYDISGGPLSAGRGEPSNYFGVFPICGPVWLSHDGSIIYSACGPVYRASNDPNQDMHYLGSIPSFPHAQSLASSDSLGQIATIAQSATPTASGTAPLDLSVNLYSSSSFNAVGRFATTPFQVAGKSFPAHGRWAFYNNSSTALFVITQADSSAGLKQDFAIENVNLTKPNSCNATFETSSATVSSPGSYEKAQIISGEDCTFAATTDVSWIVLTSGYYGSGNTMLTYLVRPNLSSSSRTGTISLGAETFALTQDGAGDRASSNPLSFKPVAADYDRPLDKLVFVSVSPNELHIYDPASFDDQIVSLPYAPLSVSVRPDGLAAGVGYSGKISIVDLVTHRVTQTLSVDQDNGGIALPENGYAYVFPSQTVSWGQINSVQLSSGTLTGILDTSLGNIPRLDVSRNYIYVGGSLTSKLDIRQGPATLVHQGFSTPNGNIWLSEDGTRLIDSFGQVFFTSADPALDLQADGSLRGATSLDWAADSAARQQTAVLAEISNASTQLQIYADNGLVLQHETSMPGFSNGGSTYISHGRYLFWNSSASKLFAITEADSTSGLLSDFVVNTISGPDSLPGCTYSVSSNVLNLPDTSSSAVIQVTASCNSLPQSTVNWISFSSLSSGSGGQLTVFVQNNTGAARSGTFSIGDQTITVNQAAGPCPYSVSPASATLPSAGGVGTIVVTTGPGCPLSAVSNSSWIRIVSSTASSASRVVQFSVAPNTSSSLQNGSLQIAGLNVPITEEPNTTPPALAVWRPSNGIWYALNLNAGSPLTSTIQQWGLPGDVPVPGDYDGDGKTDYAIWRPSTGMWWVILSRTSTAAVKQWGLPGDVPVPGDYDGDGKTDYAVWRPSTGTWYVIPSRSGGPAIVRQWGLPGDTPLAADFDGDGRADFTVWRPANGIWYVSFSGTGSTYPTPDIQRQWGLPGDVPVIGHLTADRRTDFTVWRPSTGTWYVSFNIRDISLSSVFTLYPQPDIQRQWGLPGDEPFLIDINQDGNSDFVLWRPSNGTWYVLYQGQGPTQPFTLQQQWGLINDVPVALAH